LSLESRQKGKFWVWAKFAFLHKEKTKKSKDVRERKALEND
jgi:hypothetical protein